MYFHSSFNTKSCFAHLLSISVLFDGPPPRPSWHLAVDAADVTADDAPSAPSAQEGVRIEAEAPVAAPPDGFAWGETF